MALTIHNSIAHKIDKAPRTLGVAKYRNSIFPNNNTLTRLVEEIISAYKKKPGKSHGEFEPNEVNYPASNQIREYHVDGLDFVQMSINLMGTLLAKINSASVIGTTTGGIVFIADVSEGENRWLFIVILTIKEGSFIDDDLQLTASDQLDISSLKYAGRLDILAWQDDQEKYLSFLKGKANEVSGYFKEFLGCTNVTKIAAETLTIVEGIKSFVATLDLGDDEKFEIRKKAFDYLKDCCDSDSEYEITTLAEHMLPGDSEKVVTYMCDPDLGITDHIIPSKKELILLHRVTLKTKAWQLKLEHHAKKEGYVTLDKEQNKITLHNVPVEEIEKFDDLFGDEND